MDMDIDPDSDRPVYRQLADLLREQIHSGQLPPGALLPSEPRMQQRYGGGRETIRRAMAVLRAEGLTSTKQGEGTRVRQPAQRHTIQLAPGDQAIIRVPSDLERRQLGLDEGVPIFEVTRAGADREIYPGDRTKIVVA
jgi:DNA-binding GntR family transcriptional regulator